MKSTVALVGPTASGKTALSLELAHALDAEIVNADSMQLYRGMDIGTAKVPIAQRQGIPHHLLDVLDVSQAASVAVYQRKAREVIADIHSRGKRALLVGGSGLFVNAVLDDFVFPGGNEEVRTQLEEQLALHGPQALHARLAAADPQAASHVLSTNGRRLVRALEVLAVTGQAPATSMGNLPAVIPAVRIGLTRSRADLDQRIAQRVDHMWDEGLVDEVVRLIGHGLREGRTAVKALGYQQVLAALDGQITMSQAMVDTVAATRRFVRRQEAWFKRDTHIQWFAAQDVDARALVAACEVELS